MTDLHVDRERDGRVRFHQSFRGGIWGWLTRPFWWPRYSREWDRRYPKGLSNEQYRRLADLDDPYGEYAPDDPRKYNVYDEGVDGYTPKAGKEPYRFRPYGFPTDNLSPYMVFSWKPRITREEFRRFADLGDPRDVYDRDDPRLYGVYGRGTFGYTPDPEEQPSDGTILRIWDAESNSERVVDTTRLSNEQFRRLIDLGDTDAEYEADDPRAYGDYEDHRFRTVPQAERFVWED